MSTGFRSLRDGFAEHAARRPEGTALVVRGRTLSYGELDDLARRWAAWITGRIGRPAERVGVFGSRSVVSYAGAVAALYSGAAFVPLNPRFPAERTAAMVKQADLDAVIVDELGAGQLEAVGAAAGGLPPVLRPETETAAEAPLRALPELPAERVAYLLFTSGSTGVPKGVPITHGNARAYVDWASGRYRLTPEDRCSQTFDQTFDLSVHDLFLAWENGAAVYALSPVDLLAPAGTINKQALTVWFSVPSVPAQMRKRGTLKPGSLPTLRWSLFCGEPLPQTTAEAWQAAAPNSVVENLYGPTELTIACTVHRWDPHSSPALCVNGMVAIGLPFPGLNAVLLDEELKEAREGEPGELCVTGAQTSPGYWRDAVKTAERFIEYQGRRYYRTGDRVMRLPNGEMACLGRADHQIKVLGFRVELGEIEAVLQKHEGVVQAVALGWPVAEGTAQGVVAFVAGAGLDGEAIRSQAKSALPDYMAPARVHVIDEMPLNANGKVDRGALVQRLASAEGGG